MCSCPSCLEAGIREHSVLVSLEALKASVDYSVRTYSRCARCGATFARPDVDTLVPEPLGDRVVWIVPPWKKRTPDATFQMSWDVAEAYFEYLAADLDMARPLLGLITDLRAAGYGSQLRAGQSLSSLGLSRSLHHGLRAQQSHLFIAPQPDGTVTVEGVVSGERVRFGPQPATLAGPLRGAIDRLSTMPID